MKVHLIPKIAGIFLLSCIIAGMVSMRDHGIAYAVPQTSSVIAAGMISTGVYAQEDATNSVGRVYAHRYSEFMQEDEMYLRYPEISGLEEQEYQEKINTYIQKMAWDDMFESLIFHYKDWYNDQMIWGIHKEQNELGEIRFNELILVRQYGESCYLYGRVLSMDYSGTTRSDGRFQSDGNWDQGYGWPFYKVLNIDVETQKEVMLNEILDLGDKFFQIMGEVDISQYSVDSWNIPSYDSFMDAMKDETERRKFVVGEQTRYKWRLDAQGNLRIYDETDEGLPGFKVPISLFHEVLRPEYKEYADELPGYDFSISFETGDAAISPDINRKTALGNPVIERKMYAYGEDVKFEYLQISGMSDPVLQGKANDFILDVIIDAVADDLGYAYMNNDYYREDDKERESLIFVESELPDYYLNGPVLSFTHMQETTRKAYTLEDGTRKEEIRKEPYLQAFNYDIARGKELTFGNVFEADDEFFSIIEKWTYQNGETGKPDDEIAYKSSTSIESRFSFDMKYYEDIREEFINGEVKYYHWFIDHDEEGNRLCIYRYYALDDEDQCFKIPMSILKDKLKPEYRDCYNQGEE